MLNIGEVFAGYRIERRLGAGGMGEVYVARHPRLLRSDALKVLAPQLGSDPQFRARFEREADLAASLSHPAIVKVHDRGEADGRLWIAMELVEGVDLAQRLRATGPFPAAEVASVVSTVADALDRAAGRGLVHRDVKPANILLSVDGDVLLTDFGIARMGGEASELTGTGVTVGTVNYASPEQLQGLPLDGRSDQYSLACTAFQLLTGEAPYADTNAAIVIAGHLGRPLPSVRTRRPDLAPEVDEVLARATAKSPDARYGSCSEFAAAFSVACAASVPGPTSVGPTVSPSVAPSGADPDRTIVPDVSFGEHNAPTQLRAPEVASSNATKSRRGLVLAAVAVVAVIAVVVGVVVWRSGANGPDDTSVSSEAAGLTRVLATPELASLAQQPSGPKWTYAPASGRAWKVIGGTTTLAIIETTFGVVGEKKVLDLVSADTGVLVRRIEVDKDASPDGCAAEPDGTVAMCRVSSSSGNPKVALIDLNSARIRLIDTGLTYLDVPYVDSGRFVVSGLYDRASGRTSGVQVYDAAGALVWNQEKNSVKVLPGAGVVGAVATTKSPYGDTAVLSVFRVSDGKEVLRRDNCKCIEPNLGGFAGGFSVSNGDVEELFAADGARTGTVPVGWSHAIPGKEQYDARVAYRVPSLPVFVQNGTYRVAAFTSRGAQLWSRPGLGTSTMVGLGSTVLQRSSQETSKSTNPAYKYSWFDLYTGEWGTFDGGLSNKQTLILGTDGNHFAYKVYGTNGGDSNTDLAVGGRDASWSLTYTSDQARWDSIVSFGGRLYAGTSRVV